MLGRISSFSGPTSKLFKKTEISLGIVTDGLQLYLDAGNPLSYPGSGTTWTDLSPNGYSATLQGPVYSSSSGGIITFDGSNDYVDTGQSLSSESFSLSVWFKSSNVSLYGMLFSKEVLGGSPWNYRLYLAINTGYIVGDLARVGSSDQVQYQVNMADGNWKNAVFTRNTTADTLSLYVNGYSVSSKTDATTGTFVNSQSVWIGKSAYLGGSYPFNGSIGQAMIYNKALSDSEVLQNYNATKSRYGL